MALGQAGSTSSSLSLSAMSVIWVTYTQTLPRDMALIRIGSSLILLADSAIAWPSTPSGIMSEFSRNPSRVSNRPFPCSPSIL